MQNRDTIFAKEGHVFIVIPLALFMVTLPLGEWWLTLPLALFTGFSAYFFRNPERVIPPDLAAYLSPADGRVLDVGQVKEDRYLHGEMQKISIFMSPFNVHVNRVPRTGTVVDVIYHPGKFFSANLDKASLDNEQAATIVKDQQGRSYMFVQIAGFVARRIVNYARAGKEIEAGQRVGLIRFGSRLDVYLPLEADVWAKAGQRVRAGETILGRLP
jgi:phosphatidylserine decarboxylase